MGKLMTQYPRLPAEQLFDADLQPVSDEELNRRLEEAAMQVREQAARNLHKTLLNIARRDLL